MRFSSTVRPGKMPRASGTRSTPARARRRNGSVSVISCAFEVAPCRRRRRRCPAATAHSVDFPAPLAPSSAVTLPRSSCEVDAVQHLGVAVARDDAAHRRTRAVGDVVVRQAEACARRRRRRSPGVGAMPCTSSCSGTTPPWAAASAAAMRARRAFSRFLRELLLAGEREDAVGFLRELDRAETREDRDEVDRRDQRVARRRR